MSEKVYRAIAEPDATLFHGYTYNGHPVSCAAALKNLEILLGEGLVKNAARSGGRCSDGHRNSWTYSAWGTCAVLVS